MKNQQEKLAQRYQNFDFDPGQKLQTQVYAKITAPKKSFAGLRFVAATAFSILLVAGVLVWNNKGMLSSNAKYENAAMLSAASASQSNAPITITLAETTPLPADTDTTGWAHYSEGLYSAAPQSAPAALERADAKMRKPAPSAAASIGSAGRGASFSTATRAAKASAPRSNSTQAIAPSAVYKAESAAKILPPQESFESLMDFSYADMVREEPAEPKKELKSIDTPPLNMQYCAELTVYYLTGLDEKDKERFTQAHEKYPHAKEEYDKYIWERYNSPYKIAFKMPFPKKDLELCTDKYNPKIRPPGL